MIIKCKKCNSGFNFNENLLKKEGSTVRCSVCRNVFKVFPPEPDIFEMPRDEEFSNTAMEETVALDSPPVLDDIEQDSNKKDNGYSFDKAFEDAIEEVSEDEAFNEFDDEQIAYQDEDDELLDEESGRSSLRIHETKKKGRSKILLISLLTILLFIIAALVIFFFAPGILPGSFNSIKPVTKETIDDSGTKRLNFEGVNGSFTKSEKSGQIYIIKGSVINNDQKNRSYILLKGAILDGAGKVIKQETAYAGNTFTDYQLMQMPLEDMKNSLKNRNGTDNADVDIKPGSSVPFMIIFSDLPDNLSEFTVEALSSSPGK